MGKVSGWRRLRTRYRWLDHLARAVDRYIGHSGYQYVASVTYFSLLSLVPMLMVALSAAGFVLAGQPSLLAELRDGIVGAVPGPLGSRVGGLVDEVIDQRTQVGVLGLLIGLYSGWNWMNALRDALTAMWDQQRADQPVVRTVLKDLLALVSLVMALLVSFALTVVGGVVSGALLRLVGGGDTSWAPTALRIATVALALLADWLVFLWVLARLPREPVGTRSAMRGAVAAAIGFELLKLAGSLFLGVISTSPTGAVFGSVIGLLIFLSLVSRLVVFITAWTATARDTQPHPHLPPPPDAAVLRIAAPSQSGKLVPAVVGAAVGALAAVMVGWLRGPRR